MEYEYRPVSGEVMTREQKKECLKRMLANAGVTETDLQTEMVDKLSTKELNAYYAKYDVITNKFKSKKV
jgi:ssRNA-specific RNase YbeY (16S rRNA maturation enzyme)